MIFSFFKSFLKLYFKFKIFNKELKYLVQVQNKIKNIKLYL